MVQLVNALGSKVTRGATCFVPCPVCHKKRQARHAWTYVCSPALVVCPQCFALYDVFQILKICREQGWITSYPNYAQYEVNTMFMFGDIL